MTGASIAVRELEEAGAAGELFRRRYRAAPPAFPHHVAAFAQRPGEAAQPVCYIHFTAMGRILLGGGACVDDRAMRRLDAAARSAIRAAGGLYRLTLDWALAHFAPSFDAVFGYCGDRLAERVDLAAGFARTPHPHLLVYWTRAVAADERERLVAAAHAIGPF